MAVVVDSGFLSRITAAEKNITHQDEPVEGGPTAQAQSHVGSQLNSQVIHDITMGERKITGSDLPAKRGPTAVAQHLFTQASGTGGGNNSQQRSGNHSQQHSGVLDSETISKITENEAQITGQVDPVRGGPTAKAQQHAGEPITSQALHDITEGEKKVTGGERVKGGPTSAAQSELAKSRS
ncbi:hypothetical protein BDV95DRAFT_626007 [Massariosphaeria phaeospora]|uniref:SMP domain-containing protein n=1 Tax=Massariosphaeria phaeospora TaxID=100035 RepID=A0A7C8MHA7_9PLEO|nr:hypothetical protein BDV95DRAFT_626007 [Massariosphaeria phaeospora]